MALIITPGAADADSYASIAFADAYHTAQGGVGWSTATTELKEQALRRATLWIDGRFRRSFGGYKRFSRKQALEWPRATAVDREGNSIDFDTIPPEVQMATSEAALREIATPDSLTPDFVASQRVTSQRVGELEVHYAQTAAPSPDDVQPHLTKVEQILAPILTGAGSRLSGQISR